MPGQAHDLRETDMLIRDLTADYLLADRAFDADWLRYDLLARNIISIIQVFDVAAKLECPTSAKLKCHTSLSEAGLESDCGIGDFERTRAEPH